MTNSDFFIAGNKNDYTNTYVLGLLQQLKTTEFNNVELWLKAIEILELRIQTRYFTPIEQLEKLEKFEGEGFAIVTIQCALIELFESLRKGYVTDGNITVNRKGESVRDGPFTKRGINTQTVFVHFLSENVPFKSEFSTKELKKSFYTNVRCKLMHSPQTKGGWKIQANSKKTNIVTLEGSSKTLNRVAMQKALKEWFTQYASDLKKQDDLKLNFLFVMDDICRDSRVLPVGTKNKICDWFFSYFNTT